MFCLGLISGDSFFCRALREQSQDSDLWQLVSFLSLEEALAGWKALLPPLILWDAETAPASSEAVRTLSARREACDSSLFLIVPESAPITASIIPTETFGRPIQMGFLLSRLSFHQRFLSQKPEADVRIGPFLFSLRNRTLSPLQGGEAVKLTEKEADLLNRLRRASGPVSREELLSSVWGYEAEIDTHTLETHIYRLRRKLLSEDAGEDVFITEPGGYCLNPAWRQP